MSDTPGAAPVARSLVTKIGSGYVSKKPDRPCRHADADRPGTPIIAVASEAH
jgi:hypothetical protein